MNVLYKTTAVSNGGRDGKVIVENSTLEFEMALQEELGGTKIIGVNPEQLFAASYSACCKRKKIAHCDTKCTSNGRNRQK